MGNLVPRKLTDIDFTSPNTTKKRLGALVCGNDDETTSNPGDLSPAEKRYIVSPLNKCDPKAAILRGLPDYLKQFTGNRKTATQTVNRLTR